MPGSPYSLTAFRADPLEAAFSRYQSERSGLIMRGEARKGFVDRELERPLYFSDLSHSAHLPEIGYKSVEDLESQTMDRLAVVGSQIYTDGSRIEGKVGGALTEWRDGEETCDSRSFLEVLIGSKTYHPLAHEARRDLSEIVVGGRGVCLFWVRAHAGIVGNERANELARRVNLTKKTAADYDRFKLKDSPNCTCHPTKEQEILPALEKCHMFIRERVDQEMEIDSRVKR
ncbi:hypothetical protein EVAR_44470_1 [Eumeta japonica]|uniref:RNase H type-1 domain-containing protein n=1 Tax=Eumeta variegata TaxID=151549 RepID=A0A4C1WMZ3_EUMVA|nr:hypothetical protein EVAR_44470_1 [Eumeta japonica]